MSFASDTKLEICRAPVASKCCVSAECYGILMFCNTFTRDRIKIVTENPDFAKRLPRLFKKAFGFAFDAVASPMSKGGKFILTIEDEGKLEKIFESYGHEREKILALHINFGIIEEWCCKSAFLRGAFLAGGSVTDPNKQYHLELVTDHYSVSRQMLTILLEMDFHPRDTARKGNYIIYFKKSDAIETFLTVIGAPVAAMEVMSAKILKDMTNSVNRRVNCDTANVSKIVDAAQEQVNAIRRLDKSGVLAALPDKLRDTAILRLENPELSLSQLAELSSPPVTKSCLNHRLRQLMKISEQ